jgi:predicted ABC-type ATPase
MPNLYIIAGCNGAGKTTASLSILPEILNCKEFVNADSIAAGLSPLAPEGVALEAGRIMLNRIKTLMEARMDFAFETTLSTRSYVGLVNDAKAKGYKVTLLFFFLDSPDVAVKRVSKRVSEGGHHIPSDVIHRRYKSGLENFFQLYKDIVDKWFFFDNSEGYSQEIAKSVSKNRQLVKNNEIWTQINECYGQSKGRSRKPRL